MTIRFLPKHFICKPHGQCHGMYGMEGSTAHTGLRCPWPQDINLSDSAFSRARAVTSIACNLYRFAFYLKVCGHDIYPEIVESASSLIGSHSGCAFMRTLRLIGFKLTADS